MNNETGNKQFRYEAVNGNNRDEVLLKTDNYEDILSLLDEKPHLYIEVRQVNSDGELEDKWRVWKHKITKKICEG